MPTLLDHTEGHVSSTEESRAGGRAWATPLPRRGIYGRLQTHNCAITFCSITSELPQCDSQLEVCALSQVAPDTTRINMSHAFHHLSFGSQEYPGQVRALLMLCRAEAFVSPMPASARLTAIDKAGT